MKINKYGIVLSPLTKDKLELIRTWRNDPKIQRYMEFREYITPEMQEQWFSKINNDNNYYFIINFDGKDIGLINMKNVDRISKCAEGGIFIYEGHYLNNDISFRAGYAINDFAFENLGLEKLQAHILKTNKRAIQFNKMIGYILQPGQEDIENQLYILKKEDYIKKRDRIIQLF